MKNLLTILLSLSVFFLYAQQRTFTEPKPVTHSPLGCPSLVMTPVDNSITFPADLVETILGPDITSYSNVVFLGIAGTPLASAGLFTGGLDAGLGIMDGIVLSTGWISDAIGPNTYGPGPSEGTSTGLGLSGDAQLTALAGFSTLDANVLEFDFVPNFNQLYIEFVFGSEEYNYYVGTEFNDVFAFYLNGNNIALVPSTSNPITINTINTAQNSGYYKNNDLSDLAPPVPYCNEMNGFTVKMVASGPVTPDATNHIKLAIADGSDSALDSWVFIKAESFGGVDPGVPISDWAIYIGIFLILTFAVIRFRKLV